MTDPRNAPPPQPAMYRIQVQGWIDERWAGWFDDLTISQDRASDGTPRTTLSGALADQTALRGILARIWDLNLALLSVVRIPDEHPQTDEEELSHA